ncbi:MAG TPA: DUF981 family protein [Thermoplasmata archaeon]|nr:DUF981 family protein [Thermoplasmata archaeon]
MAFIDDLTLIEDLLVLVAAAVFYTGFFVILHWWKKDPERARNHLREGAFVLGILGALLAVIAVEGEFVWPLPGAYNIYFFDPLFMLSFLLVAFGVAVWRGLPTHFVGMLSLVTGSGIIFYGVRAYQLGLTKDPFETLLLYLGFGAMGILAYPATLFVDWGVVGPQEKGSSPLVTNPVQLYPRLWLAILAIFMVIVVLAGVAAIAYGFSSVWSHLGSPP